MFPILFKLGWLTLHTYGFLLSTAYVVGLYTASRFAKKQGLGTDQVIDLGLIVAFSALIGAKVFLIFEDWTYYTTHPREIFSMSTLHAGGVFYGGFLFAVAAAIIYLVRKHIPVLPVTDAFAPGVVLGHAIGRLGCFSAGCCWGKPTHLPWAVTFTNPYSRDLVGVPLHIALHPTQLYEAAANLCIFLFLAWRFTHKKFDGQIFSLYLLSYGAWRFVVEFLRAHEESELMFGGAISDSQCIALACIAIGLVLYFSRRRKAHA
jgi:phosphatidylglycerol:prolipoprotein diacylglycerol transferase